MATVTALVVASGAFTAAASAAPRISCGSVITASVTLTKDLDCSSTSVSSALTIGANGITLDLGGHTITGGEGSGTGAGISNAGFDSVTIRNGTLFADYPVLVTNGSNDNHISNLSGETGNGEFIWIKNSQRTLIENISNASTTDGFVVELDNCSGATLRNFVDQDGVFLFNTTNSTVSGNTFGPGNNAVYVSGGSKNTVTNNVTHAENGEAILVYGGGGDVVSNNVSDHGWQDIAVAATATNTLVSGNTDIDAQDQGISVSAGTTGTILQNNTARTNGADGIHSDSKSVTISGNTSTGNAVWGIRTVAGATNGGANSAYGNTAGSCSGLTCFGPVTGNQAVGTKWTAVTLNAKRASRFAAPALTSADQVQLYMDGNGGASGSEVMRAVVYSDNGGKPDKLLATTNQVSIAKGRKAGWVGFTFPKTLTLQAGTFYWVGLISGATGKVARYAGTSATGALRWNTDTYTDGAAATFGTATTDSTNMSIFAG